MIHNFNGLCALALVLGGCLPTSSGSDGGDGAVGDGGPDGLVTDAMASDADASDADASDADVGDGDGGAQDAAPDAPAPPPVILEDFGALYVGGWRRVAITVDPAAGYGFDDLEFSVVEGKRGGQISPNRDDAFDPAAPEILLLGGWLPGTYTLRASQGGAPVAEVSFELNLQHDDPDNGPPFWFQGQTTEAPIAPTSAWGDPNDAGVQNFNVNPQSGNRHVLLLFVDFDEARYDPMDVDAFKQNWMDHMVNGVSVGGSPDRDAATLFDEISGGVLTFSAEAAGPISMDETFAEFWEDGWWDTLPQPAITKAIEAGITFEGVDTIAFITPQWDLGMPPPCAMTNGGEEVCDGIDNDCDGDVDALDSDVMECSADPTCGDGNVDPGEQCDDGNDVKYDRCHKCEIRTRHYAWPQAGGPYGPWTIEEDADGDSQQKSFGLVSMPNDWTALDGRQVYATLAHELGHTIGLGDLYTPDVPDRNVGGWDLMHAERRIPHLSLSQRLALGWVDPDDVFAFNPGAAAETNVELSPVGRITPDGDRYIGAEVRLGPGFNYYFEYRLRQPGIGDHGDPIPQLDPGVILGTDRISNRSESAIARPSVILVPTGPDSDGHVLTDGDTFRQQDGPQQLRVTNNGGDADGAELLIEYGIFRPDPAIREWAGPSWQSPDIEVRNAKSDADPDNWRNVPWAGEKNTLVAKVFNGGKEDAPAVRVNFSVKNFNVAGAPAQFIDFVVEDVPAGDTVEFVCPDCWTPPNVDNPHFCVVAEIDLYQHPMTLAVEATQFNNIAQSNYTKFWSDSSSPARRVTHTVEVGNPYDERAVVLVDAGQTHPDFRTYVEHRWVRLDPGEVRPVRVMYEYKRDLDAVYLEQREIPTNGVHLRGMAMPPELGLEDERGLRTLGGVTSEVTTGYRTRVELGFIEMGNAFQVRASVISAAPAGVDPPGGRAVVVARYANGDALYFAGGVVDGVIDVQGQPSGFDTLDIEYLGDPPHAPSALRGVTPP